MPYGFASFIGIAKESDWGTAVAATDYFEALSESLATNIARFEDVNLSGGYYEPDDNAGMHTHAGDVVLPAHPVSLGYFLNGAFGVNSITTVLSGVLFQNDFSVKQADVSSFAPLPAYTLEIFRAGSAVNSSFRYTGNQVNMLTLDVRPNQELRVTAGLIPKTRSIIAKTTPSFPGSPSAAFLFDTCSMSWAGVGNANFEGVTVTLNNQLIGVPTLNQTTEIAKVRRTGPPMVEVSGTTEFVDMDDYNRFIDQDENRLFMTLTKANSFQLVVDLPRLVFTGYPVSVAGKDRITVSFNMKGRYHVGSAAALTARLITTNTY